MFTKTTIEQYFMSEKSGAMILTVIGVAAIVFAAISWFVFKTQVWKGFAVMLTLIAIIQLIVGGAVYSRSDKQRTDMVYNFDMNPQKIMDEEIPRMQEVNNRFITYRYVETVCFMVGIFLILYFRKNTTQQFWAGIGFALALQAIVLFTTDKIAESRAKSYTENMVRYFKKPV